MSEIGPGGTLSAQHQQIVQSASAKAQTGANSFSSQHQQSYASAAGKGALNGFLSSGPWGALFGAAGSIATQAIANKQNKSSTAKAQEQARENAAHAFASSQASQSAANEWNRESSQVQRYIEAGLSPGLMYGQMSDSTASAVSAPAADTVQPMASALQDPHLLEALGLYLQQLQTGSNVGLQGAQSRNLDANTQGTQIDNLTRNQRNVQEIQSSIASMYQMLAAAGKANAETDRIKRLIDLEYKQLEKAIQVSDSQISVNNSTVNTLHPSQAAANYAGARASNAQAAYTNGPLTSKTNQESLNLKVQENRGSFDLIKDQDSYNWASAFLQEHGYDGELAPQLLNFLDTAPSEVLKGGVRVIESWLDGGNWLKFIQDWRRTNHWSGNQGNDGDNPARPSTNGYASKKLKQDTDPDNFNASQLNAIYHKMGPSEKAAVSDIEDQIRQYLDDMGEYHDNDDYRAFVHDKAVLVVNAMNRVNGGSKFTYKDYLNLINFNY